jgi:hypothetical protein
MIARLERVQHGSTQPGNMSGWPHFDANAPTLQDIQNVFNWLVNNCLTQPLEKPADNESSSSMYLLLCKNLTADSPNIQEKGSNLKMMC